MVTIEYELYYAKSLRQWGIGGSRPTQAELGQTHRLVLNDTYTFDDEDTVSSQLEQLFLRFNQQGNPLTTPERQQLLSELLEVPHTSMSVGDVIRIGRRYYAVEGVGFSEITDGPTEECRVCAGKGFSTVMVPDPETGNDSFRDERCGECNGTGRIVIESEDPEWTNDRSKAIAAAVDVLEEEVYRLEHGEYRGEPEVVFEINQIQELLEKLRPWIQALNYQVEEVTE